MTDITVRDIYQWINERAPFETQLGFDNAGLLLGRPDTVVTRVHFALDATPSSVREALDAGAQLMVTHHPLMFSAIKTLREDRYEPSLLCEMVRGNLAMIAAHTNLDRAPGGMNDVLASVIGLTDVRGEDFLRTGRLPHAMSAGEFEKYLSERLHTAVRRMGPEDRVINTVGLCSGAGSEDWEAALREGADGFVTGEVKHHHALAAAASGMVMFECGHHATEEPGIFALADSLQNTADALKWRLRVTKSQAGGYPCL